MALMHAHFVAVTDRTELVTALAEHRAQHLLGTAEAGWVDFKRSPYLLDTPRGKWELAKDVAAMANASGGLLVVGVGTTRPPEELEDVASKLTPFPRALARPDAMRGVLADWLVPPLHPGLKWFSSAPDSDKYFLVVTVEALPERERYVLVNRTVDDDGKITQSFGVPVRRGDATEWLTAESLRLLIRDGLRHQSMHAPDPPRHAHGPTDPDAARRRADAALDQLATWQGLEPALPVLRLTSWVDPPPPALPGLYASDGIRGYLDGPNELRPPGFHFHTPYRQSEALPGAIGLNSRHGLGVLVGQDGTVTAGIAANRTLLARSNEGSPELPVSSIVLTELLYEYFRLVDEQVAPRAPGTWTHRLTARNFASSNVTLAPGTPDKRWMSDAHRALQDDYEFDFPASGNPAQDAGSAIGLFYNLFGMDSSDSPFTSEGKTDIAGFMAAITS